jgi:hypothetical protein
MLGAPLQLRGRDGRVSHSLRPFDLLVMADRSDILPCLVAGGTEQNRIFFDFLPVFSITILLLLLLSATLKLALQYLSWWPATHHQPSTTYRAL